LASPLEYFRKPPFLYLSYYFKRDQFFYEEIAPEKFVPAIKEKPLISLDEWPWQA